MAAINFIALFALREEVAVLQIILSDSIIDYVLIYVIIILC